MRGAEVVMDWQGMSEAEQLRRDKAEEISYRWSSSKEKLKLWIC